MDTARIVQVSDPHLSRRHGFFVGNWATVVRRLADEPADLVVSSGDLSINGADDDDDLRFAMEQHARLSAPWRVIAGNHDIGEEYDAQLLGQPIDAQRIERWEQLAGDHHWNVDLGAWRLVGIDGFLYGTGRPAEERQHDWLTSTLATWDGPTGLFVHKPLFLDTPDETVEPHFTFTPANRARLLELVQSSNVRFVASGHLHQSRVRQWEGITFVWAPSTAFPAGQALPGASVRLGWVEHVLSGDDHHAEIVTDAGLVAHQLASFKDDGRYQYLYQVSPSPPDPADL